MRVRDHIVLSSCAVVVAWPWLGRAALLPWIASILIDIDHYLFFIYQRRQVDPLAAVQFFDQAQPPQHLGTRLLHTPLVLALLVPGRRWRVFRLFLLGMVFHIGLDLYHLAKTRNARREALRRDNFTCQQCGDHYRTIVAHLQRQPRFLPSYDVECYTALCSRCHEAVHSTVRARTSHLGRPNGVPVPGRTRRLQRTPRSEVN